MPSCSPSFRSVFFYFEVGFLGFIVGAYGIRMDPDRIKVILEWPIPRIFRDI